MLLSIGFAVAAEDIRHFQLRAIHGLPLRSTGAVAGLGSAQTGLRQKIEWTGGRADLAGGDPQIPGGGRQAAVAEQQLNGPDIGARFQQVNGECVSKRVRCNRLADTGRLRAFLQARSTAVWLMWLAGNVAWKKPVPGFAHSPPSRAGSPAAWAIALRSDPFGPCPGRHG